MPRSPPPLLGARGSTETRTRAARSTPRGGARRAPPLRTPRRACTQHARRATQAADVPVVAEVGSRCFAPRTREFHVCYGRRRATVVVNLKICCALGDVPHTSPEMRIRHESCIKNVEPSGRLFQVQTTSEPAAARAISRRTRFEGEASADEAYSPGSGAVQVSGRWKRAILCPTTRPVRKTCKSW